MLDASIQNQQPHPVFYQISKFHREFAVTFSLLAISIAYIALPSLRDILQDCYWIPIVVSAATLGWRRSSAFTVLGVLLVLCVTVSNWQEWSFAEFMKHLISCCTLGTTAAVIGLISSRKEHRFSDAIHQQSSLALTDPLTGIANRRAHDFELQRRIEDFKRYSRKLSLLMIDIDHFKQFNDQFGHAIGDVVLKRVADEIQGTLRAADLAARYGGEEFTVLMPNTDVDQASVAADRIRANIASIPAADLGCTDPLTVSIGVAVLRFGDDSDSVMRRADRAMYVAKKKGRNCVSIGDSLADASEYKVESEAVNADLQPDGQVCC